MSSRLPNFSRADMLLLCDSVDDVLSICAQQWDLVGNRYNPEPSPLLSPVAASEQGTLPLTIAASEQDTPSRAHSHSLSSRLSRRHKPRKLKSIRRKLKANIQIYIYIYTDIHIYTDIYVDTYMYIDMYVLYWGSKYIYI